MFNLIRIEEKFDIDASAKTVFGILKDIINTPKWNLLHQGVKQVGDNRFVFKTEQGEATVTLHEIITNKSVTLKHENEESPYDKVGIILTPKADGVEVTDWGDLKDESQLETVREMTKEITELFHKCLKVYAEYLESGGNPDDFDKTEILAIQ